MGPGSKQNKMSDEWTILCVYRSSASLAADAWSFRSYHGKPPCGDFKGRAEFLRLLLEDKGSPRVAMHQFEASYVQHVAP